MLDKILGSKTKQSILLYLGLRGASSGHRLSSILGIGPSQTFKALRSLIEAGVIRHFKRPSLYALNPHHPFNHEIVRLIEKEAEMSPQAIKKFYPRIPANRKIDLPSILNIIQFQKSPRKVKKLSDVLREKYA